MTRYRTPFAVAFVAAFAIGLFAWSELDAQATWRMPVKSGLTTGSLIYASSRSNFGAVDAVASGQVLTSAGTGTKPAYSASPTLTALTSPTVTAATALVGSGTGLQSGFVKQIVSAASGTTALTAAMSGAVVMNTGTSSTTTFTLPAAAVGLNYCFVENGDAAGELLVGVTGTNTVVGKTHGADDGTGIATASSTGIKNTAGTNVKGDFACLVAISSAQWAMTSVAGVWASR